MKRILMILFCGMLAMPAAGADEIDRDWDVAGYRCSAFQADRTDAPRYAAAAQYVAVYLHVGLEVVGLPHRPITPEREGILLGHLQDLCGAAPDADFRLVLTRYLRSATFRDWWQQQDA